jgi:hypothetical protein
MSPSQKWMDEGLLELWVEHVLLNSDVVLTLPAAEGEHGKRKAEREAEKWLREAVERCESEPKHRARIHDVGRACAEAAERPAELWGRLYAAGKVLAAAPSSVLASLPLSELRGVTAFQRVYDASTKSRAAVLTWLLVAPRLGVSSETARFIGQLVWRSRSGLSWQKGSLLFSRSEGDLALECLRAESDQALDMQLDGASLDQCTRVFNHALLVQAAELGNAEAQFDCSRWLGTQGRERARIVWLSRAARGGHDGAWRLLKAQVRAVADEVFSSARNKLQRVQLWCLGQVLLERRC